MTDPELRSRRRLRSEGLARLRRYTTLAVVGAAGLVGFVSVLAAGSMPGRSTGQQPAQPAQPAAAQQDPFQQSSNSGQAQPPSNFGSGGGSPWAVSGGS